MNRKPGTLLAAVSAGRALASGTVGYASDATKMLRMHCSRSKRNNDACRATTSDASWLHQVRAAGDVPGHRGRGAARHA
jgi:hypothetical protein